MQTVSIRHILVPVVVSAVIALAVLPLDLVNDFSVSLNTASGGAGGSDSGGYDGGGSSGGETGGGGSSSSDGGGRSGGGSAAASGGSAGYDGGGMGGGGRSGGGSAAASGGSAGYDGGGYGGGGVGADPGGRDSIGGGSGSATAGGGGGVGGGSAYASERADNTPSTNTISGLDNYNAPSTGYLGLDYTAPAPEYEDHGFHNSRSSIEDASAYGGSNSPAAVGPKGTTQGTSFDKATGFVNGSIAGGIGLKGAAKEIGKDALGALKADPNKALNETSPGLWDVAKAVIGGLVGRAVGVSRGPAAGFAAKEGTKALMDVGKDVYNNPEQYNMENLPSKIEQFNNSIKEFFSPAPPGPLEA